MLIGLLGVASSGKSTVAKHIATNHGSVEVSLADPIKRYCMDAYDFTENQLWGPSSARNKPDERYPREHSFNGTNACLCCGDGLWATHPKQCFLTPRYCLQNSGTQWGRHCFEETWVNKTIRIAQQLLGSDGHNWKYDKVHGLNLSLAQRKHEHVVVSDVRFRNEVSAIKKAGGKVWRIVLANAPSNKESWRNHASEAEQTEISDSEFDVVIVNTKTEFSVLYEAVDLALKS